MLAVVSSSILSKFIFSIALAATIIALIPASGSRPAWAVFPNILTFITSCAGAFTIISPGEPPLSNINAYSESIFP